MFGRVKLCRLHDDPARKSLMNRVLVAIAAIVFAWLHPAMAQTLVKEQAFCGVPQVAKDGWRVETQTKAGIDPQPLCALTEKIKNSNTNVHSVIVVRDGSLVFEHYRTGFDQKWGTPIGQVDHGPDVKHDLRSATKSVVSLLVGIALDRRLIASIDDPVFEFFPEYASLRTPATDRILLRHLLTMSSGLAWDENRPYSDPTNSEIRMIFALDPYRNVLEQPLATEPGKEWNYSGGSTALLGAILQKVSKKKLLEFAREALFDPLGIVDVEWVTMPNGEVSAASGLRLRPRDMAKLGQLVLMRGIWNGKQILSATRLEESVKGRFDADSVRSEERRVGKECRC